MRSLLFDPLFQRLLRISGGKFATIIIINCFCAVREWKPDQARNIWDKGDSISDAGHLRRVNAVYLSY